MVSVYQVYQSLKDLANKEQKGFITPQVFNNFSALAQLNIYNEMFSELSSAKRLARQNFDPGRDKSIRKQRLEDLSFYIKRTEIDASENDGSIEQRAISLKVNLDKKDDPRANVEFNLYEDRMARLMAVMIGIFDPDVIVLGGGTSSTYNNRVQLGMAGDRVATAARLYHSGQVKKIICTGSQSFRASPEDLHPREEAKLILTEFGIPASAVILLEGENTSQEMNSLKSWIPEHINSPQPRVGLITSAWHLNRALRLAKSQGLEFEPIPSNFISGPVNPSPHWVIPSGDNLATTGRIVKEYLAAIVSR